MTQPTKPIRIMWQSDSPMLPTGYGQVTRNVLSRLQKDPEFEVIAVAANGLQGMNINKVELEDGQVLDYPILSQSKEQYNKDSIISNIQKYKPDVMCFLQDTFMYDNPRINGMPWLSQLDFPCKTLFYYPSDGDPLPIGCEHILRKMTVPAGMSKFACEQVKRDHDIEATYIPHGVNTKDFFPLKESKEELRKEQIVNIIDKQSRLIAMKDFLKNKFVVFSAFRNQGRKMVDRQLKSWAEFSKDKDNVVMFMHTDPLDNSAAFDIRALINRLDINNSVCFSGLTFQKPFTNAEINKLYNMSDIFFQSTSGEGWGLCTTEAMCCELPIVITDYTTTDEIVRQHEAGICVPLSGDLTGMYNVERGLMDVEAGSDALDVYYDDWKGKKELITKHGKNGRKGVLKDYDWDKIVELYWKPLFKEMAK